MTAAQISAVHTVATHPAQRLAIALAAVHAARGAMIRTLTLDDLDVSNRRITLAGHQQLLGDLTSSILLAWLDHRRRTWPHTANRHVLGSRFTALGTEPVTADYLESLLGGRVDVEQIRQDRILQEALATDADPLQLALVFGLDHTTAMSYAKVAQHLLVGPAEHAHHGQQ